MDRKTFENIRNTLNGLIKETVWENHVYLVGGCVRDDVMNNPVKDVDIVIDLPDGGIKFVSWLKENEHTTQNVIFYPHYGTVMFRLANYPDIEIEAVQTRKEKYTDINTRNPETVYGTLYEDCFRRDLTINALYYNISTSKLVDPTGKGLDDIHNHTIRTSTKPDVVYNDDPLRILRCIRFSARFGWEIEKNTWNGILRNVGRLSIITSERKRDELIKMLTCRFPAQAMKMLAESGAMQYVIPELEDIYKMERKHYQFGSVWEHILKVLQLLDNADPVLMMAGLLHNIGKITTRTESLDGKVHLILKRLKFTNDFIKEVKMLVKNYTFTKSFKNNLPMMEDKDLRRLQFICGSKKRLEQLLSLIEADNRYQTEEFCSIHQVDLIRERNEQLIKNGTAMFNYEPPLTGEEIMRITKKGPGRYIRAYQEYLLKLSFIRPIREHDEWINQIEKFNTASII